MIVGIDPGNYGAIAVLDLMGSPLFLWDMTVKKYQVNGRKRFELDWNGLIRCESEIEKHSDVWIEKQWVRPLDGAVSAAQIVGMYRALTGFFLGRRHHVHAVAPQKWKARWPELYKNADAVVPLAESMFPSQNFRGTQGRALDGRADAILLAEYGRTFQIAPHKEGGNLGDMCRAIRHARGE